jgi:nitrite reductase/ring-hydroxylating ferredoxin subunit
MSWRSHPAAPPVGTVLCRLDAIPDGEGREFVFGQGSDALRLFVVRKGEAAWGYVNLCPHNYIALNDQPDRFVTYDRAWIVCSAHGAVFRYEDGFCEDGPCRGRSLEAVSVTVTAGTVLVA